MSGFISSPYILSAPPPPAVGGAALIVSETDAMGIDFTYATDVTKQMRVTTANVSVDSDPSTKLTYASPSPKLTRRASGIWTFTNGSTELPYEWDASAVPQGLLIEEARTNVYLQSQTLNAINLNNASISANATTAPDGSSTADKIVPDTSNNKHDVAPTIMTVGSPTACSFFAKVAGYNYAAARIFSSGQSSVAVYNLSNGTVSLTDTTHAGATFSNVAASIIDAGNGWYRCILTFLNATSATEWNISPSDIGNPTPNAFSEIVFTGDGTSGIYAWGVQVEAGAFASSYIVTTTTPASRNSDDGVQLLTSAFPYAAAGAGTMVTAFYPKLLPSSGNRKVSRLYDPGVGNEIVLYYYDSAGVVTAQITTGGVPQTNAAGSQSVTAAAISKIGIGYATNDVALVVNGVVALTDATASMPSPTALSFGSSGAGVVRRSMAISGNSLISSAAPPMANSRRAPHDDP